MNQIFRITVGPETIEGRLPTLRVGQGYYSLFHIAGVSPTEAAPKVWITTEGDTQYWTAEWDTERGVWVATVSNAVTQVVGSYAYAVTMGGADDTDPEYIAGQGVFVVYTNIAAGGIVGKDGTSIVGMISALEARIAMIESVLEAGAELGMFDPEAAYDIDMRNQVQAITNILRGYGEE